MKKKEIASLGGKARAKIQKEESLQRYYENPSICKNCGNIIKVKDNQRIYDVKIKKFCNSSCSTSFNNKNRITGQQSKKEIKVKENKINPNSISHLTKGELYKRNKDNFSSRSAICKNARIVYRNSKKDKCCLVCKYDKYYEVCHIKPVSEFTNDAKISEINDINNLAALCPNHHKEYDNNLIDINNYT